MHLRLMAIKCSAIQISPASTISMVKVFNSIVLFESENAVYNRFNVCFAKNIHYLLVHVHLYI